MELPESGLMYSLIVNGYTDEQYLFEDIPHEYRVYKNENVAGIIIWGRYKDKWYPNPSCRHLVFTLLTQLNES